MMYDKVIQKSSSKELGKFTIDNIVVDVKVKKIHVRITKPLSSKFKNLKKVPSGKKG